jgi:hypothetical protein
MNFRVQSSLTPGGGLVPYGEGDSSSDTEDESSAPSSLNPQEKTPLTHLFRLNSFANMECFGSSLSLSWFAVNLVQLNFTFLSLFSFSFLIDKT